MLNDLRFEIAKLYYEGRFSDCYCRDIDHDINPPCGTVKEGLKYADKVLKLLQKSEEDNRGVQAAETYVGWLKNQVSNARLAALKSLDDAVEVVDDCLDAFVAAQERAVTNWSVNGLDLMCSMTEAMLELRKYEGHGKEERFRTNASERDIERMAELIESKITEFWNARAEFDRWTEENN